MSAQTQKDLTTQFKTKREAFAAARRVRAAGVAVKVQLHEGIYTQPFRGIASYSFFALARI